MTELTQAAQRMAADGASASHTTRRYERGNPVGAENRVTLCDPGIFMDQAAEPVPAQNPDVCARSGWMRTPGRRALLQRPVRPVGVVMVGVLIKDQPQVPFAGDQHPVQALAACAGDPSFGDRVRPGRPVPLQNPSHGV
jgi:hypothetical protein